jgi:hypothetical protein
VTEDRFDHVLVARTRRDRKRLDLGHTSTKHHRALPRCII